MTIPQINISQLDPASPIDSNNDLLLVRQGLNDRKATVDQINNLRLSAFNPLPGSLQSTDVFLVGRNVAGQYQNYLATPQSIGFYAGTVCYFWMASAPVGWTIVPNSGDRVLATALPGGASYQYNTVGLQGTWQQENHVLTIAEMPAHNHTFPMYETTSTNNKVKVGPGKNDIRDTIPTSTVGGNQGHNHGSTWRPAALVGILCQKVA